MDFGYDDQGNLLSLTQTDVTTNTAPYSTSGQTRTWNFSYGGFGQRLTASGPRTDIRATNFFAYDATNNLSAVINPLGQATIFTNYDGSGLPGLVIDPNGVATTLAFDLRGRLLSRAVLAASGDAITTFGHDLAGQLISTTLPDGTGLYYQYDTAHRLRLITNALGEQLVYYRDAAGNATQQVVLSASAAVVKTRSRQFDPLNRLLQDIGASLQTTRYGYDAQGNPTEVTDGLQQSTVLVFDALNRLSSIADPLNYQTSLARDTQDNCVSVTDPRQLVTSFVYDGFGRVIQESSPDRGTTVYILDEAGNRVLATDARGVVTRRAFDALNRIQSESYPASPGENVAYTYDSPAAGAFGLGRLTGYMDETGSTSLAYNERGDMVKSTRQIGATIYSTGYAYDLADRVQSITYPSSHVIRYGRDRQGRIESVAFDPGAGGSATVVAIADRLGSADWIRVATNTGPFSFTDGLAENSAARFYRVVQAPDTNAATPVCNLRFPGQYFDAESGLCYNGMRTYDPTLGRYLEADPLGLGGGLNIYRYALNNPLNVADALGLEPCGVVPDSESSESGGFLGALETAGEVVGAVAVIAVAGEVILGAEIVVAGAEAIAGGVEIGVDALAAGGVETAAPVTEQAFADAAIEGASEEAAEGAQNFVYRGVHVDHPALDADLEGRVVPRNVNGTVTAAEHNLGGFPRIVPSLLGPTPSTKRGSTP